jgi:hypothetical protein
VTGSSLVLASNHGGLGEVCGPLLREFWLTPHEMFFTFTGSPALAPLQRPFGSISASPILQC